MVFGFKYADAFYEKRSLSYVWSDVDESKGSRSVVTDEKGANAGRWEDQAPTGQEPRVRLREEGLCKLRVIWWSPSLCALDFLLGCLHAGMCF